MKDVYCLTDNDVRLSNMHMYNLSTALLNVVGFDGKGDKVNVTANKYNGLLTFYNNPRLGSNIQELT